MEELLVQNVEFIQSSNIILIPKKMKSVVEYINEDLLKQINKDIKVAKELCLIFTSFLYQSKFTSEKYKRLNSKLLSEIFKPATSKSKNTIDNTYKHIINVLLKGTDNGAIIEVDESYNVGMYSKGYKLTERYLTGFMSYELKTKYAKDVKYKEYTFKMMRAHTNTIAKNSLRNYSKITLPTVEDLLEKGKRLVKEKYITKKGKKLTLRRRQPNSYWVDADKRSFIEDDIEMFEYYTSNGFIIPIVGEEHCPRVYDSINLLPTWIREEIKLHELSTIESDYKALHPNIIMNLFGGNSKYITHEEVAENLGVSKKEVKTEHLSFFNKQNKSLYNSILFNYYQENEFEMLERLMQDKNTNGYKNTSKLTFTVESKIMETVIEELNKLDISVIYIFDALSHNEEDKDIVNAVMNKVIVDTYKVYTSTGYMEDSTDYNNIIETYNKELLFTTISSDSLFEDEMETSNDALTENNTNTLETKESSLEARYEAYKKDFLEIANTLPVHYDKDLVIKQLFNERYEFWNATRKQIRFTINNTKNKLK